MFIYIYWIIYFLCISYLFVYLFKYYLLFISKFQTIQKSKIPNFQISKNPKFQSRSAVVCTTLYFQKSIKIQLWDLPRGVFFHEKSEFRTPEGRNPSKNTKNTDLSKKYRFFKNMSKIKSDLFFKHLFPIIPGSL